MKRNNKKGFTIVELVIVIAVIAILSAVLIPTFGGITEKANISAAQQEGNNAYKNYLIYHDYKTVDLDDVNGYVVVDDKYYFAIENGQFIDTVLTEAPAAGTGNVYALGNASAPGVYLVTACAHAGVAAGAECSCGVTLPTAP